MFAYQQLVADKRHRNQHLSLHFSFLGTGHFESEECFCVVKFNVFFHEPILGNDKYEFKSVHILEVGIQISLINDCIKCTGSKISTSFSEFLSETCGKFQVCYSICVLNLDFFAYLVAIYRFRCGWFRIFLHDRTCTTCYWLSAIYNANSFRSAHLYLFFKRRKFNIKRRCRVQHHACFRYSICI